VRIFGIAPGSDRTGYGCVETDGTRHRLVVSGAISAGPRATFPEKLQVIHARLAVLLAQCRPECVAIESLFYATNVRSALKLGHARGVAMLAAVEAGVPVVEYSPAEVKRAVVGYGRAEKPQVQQMVKLLLGLAAVPSPHDAADALAIAICHGNAQLPVRMALPTSRGAARSWRDYEPGTGGRASRTGSPSPRTCTGAKSR
jgi:crossover junction endodeoxyribonuclease RuvC